MGHAVGLCIPGFDSVDDPWSVVFSNSVNQGTVPIGSDNYLGVESSKTTNFEQPSCRSAELGHVESSSQEFVFSVPSSSSVTAPTSNSQSHSNSNSSALSYSNSIPLSISHPPGHTHYPQDSNTLSNNEISSSVCGQDRINSQCKNLSDDRSYENKSEDRSCSQRSTMVNAKSRAEIRRARAARNRSSARRSRLRKKAETERDKEKVELVEKRNLALKAQVKQLHEEMLALKEVVDELGIVQYNYPQ